MIRKIENYIAEIDCLFLNDVNEDKISVKEMHDIFEHFNWRFKNMKEETEDLLSFLENEVEFVQRIEPSICQYPTILDNNVILKFKHQGNVFVLKINVLDPCLEEFRDDIEDGYGYSIVCENDPAVIFNHIFSWYDDETTNCLDNLKESLCVLIARLDFENTISPFNSKSNDILIPFEDEYRWGYKDNNGTIIIKPSFGWACDFHGDLAVVQQPVFYVEDIYVGCINRMGELIIPFEFEEIGEFVDGLARACKNRKWGYINEIGKTVIDYKYDQAFDFYKGNACVFFEGKGVVIDTQGNVILQDENYDSIGADCEGIRIVSFNNKKNCINESGEKISKKNFDKVINCKDGLIVVVEGEKCGVINKNGRMIVDFIYDNVMTPSEGRIAVNKGNKWGYLDYNGIVIIDFDYDGVSWFKNGLAVVKRNGKCGFIDRMGVLNIGCFFEEALPFCEGLAAVKLNKKWGFIDKNGSVVIDEIYNSVSSFNNGLAKVEIEDEVYYIDYKGNRV